MRSDEGSGCPVAHFQEIDLAVQHGVVAVEQVAINATWPCVPEMHVQSVECGTCGDELIERIESAPGASADNEPCELARIRTDWSGDGLNAFHCHKAGNQGSRSAAINPVAQEGCNFLLRLAEKNLDVDSHSEILDSM
jgi:hypothetical protein